MLCCNVDVQAPHTVADRTAERIHALERYLRDQARACLRPPVDRFAHPWLAPMPLSPAAAGYLKSRGSEASFGHPAAEARTMADRDSGDGFAFGDYSLGLFHHDASEAAIELSQHEEFQEAALGSLLCFLDCASPTGLVHRIELPYKAREAEPAKPVMAHFARITVEAMGSKGLEMAEQHRVLPRVSAFIEYLEREYTGLHGLFITHSSRNSGFDNDILTAGMRERSVEGPDTNAFMVREYRALAALARMLGHDDQADRAEAKAEVLADRVNRLMWYEDERGGMYVALEWHHGVGSLDGEIVGFRDPDGIFRPAESWSTLVPLYAGIPDETRAEKLVLRLLDGEGYWGPHGVRTAPAHDPFYNEAPRVLLHDPRKDRRGPVSNWMGPVWVLSNYYMAHGLARYGYRDRARELATKTAQLLANDLAATGMLHENYADDGRGLWPRRGTFISWNVLAATLIRDFGLD